jgi:hypothetical protein
METIEQIAEFFAENKIQCYASYYPQYANTKWRVKAEKQEDGIKLEVESFSPLLFDAMLDVYEKFTLTAQRGNSQLLALQLEYRKADMEIVNGDDIPF